MEKARSQRKSEVRQSVGADARLEWLAGHAQSSCTDRRHGSPVGFMDAVCDVWYTSPSLI